MSLSLDVQNGHRQGNEETGEEEKPVNSRANFHSGERSELFEFEIIRSEINVFLNRLFKSKLTIDCTETFLRFGLMMFHNGFAVILMDRNAEFMMRIKKQKPWAIWRCTLCLRLHIFLRLAVRHDFDACSALKR